MMAIHESDMVVYKEIDRVREEKRLAEWIASHQSAGKSVSAVIPPLPGRRMEAHEAPSGIHESMWKTKGMQAMAATVGKEPIAPEDLSAGRKRKEVVYDDGLTDLQYCRGKAHTADR